MKKYKFYVLFPELILASLYALVAFLSVYALQDTLSNFVNSFPAFLSHGFEIAGGLLPAVGLGLLLKVMLKKENAAYLIIGFLMMSVLSLNNVLPIAFMGIALAAIGYMHDKHTSENQEGGQEDGDGI